MFLIKKICYFLRNYPSKYLYFTFNILEPFHKKRYPFVQIFRLFHFFNSNTCDISVSKLQPISVGHVALGLSNGDLELYCRTKSEHITLLWTKVRTFYILHTCAPTFSM